MIDSFAIENVTNFLKVVGYSQSFTFVSLYLQCPPSAFYISEFLNIDEEKEVMKNIYNAPKTKWTQLSRRRLQNWGGLPHPNGMVSEPIPQVLFEINSYYTHHKAI